MSTTRFNEIQDRVEWVGAVVAYALLIPVVCMTLEYIGYIACITFICSFNCSAMVLSQTQLVICASCEMSPRDGSQILLTIQPASIATLIWNVSEIRVIPGAEVSTYIHFVWSFLSQIPGWILQIIYAAWKSNIFSDTSVSLQLNLSVFLCGHVE